MTHDQNDQVVSKLFLTSASQPQNLTHEKWNTEIPLQFNFNNENTNNSDDSARSHLT